MPRTSNDPPGTSAQLRTGSPSTSGASIDTEASAGRMSASPVSTVTRRQLPDAPAAYGPDFIVPFADVTRRGSGLWRRCYIMRPLSFQRRTLVVGRAGAGWGHIRIAILAEGCAAMSADYDGREVSA